MLRVPYCDTRSYTIDCGRCLSQSRLEFVGTLPTMSFVTDWTTTLLCSFSQNSDEKIQPMEGVLDRIGVCSMRIPEVNI
jgi:hypothetical protein